MKTPELAIADGAPGLEKALAALWSDNPVQRCTVHKHRNLLAHAPDRLHDELSANYKDTIYAVPSRIVLELSLQKNIGVLRMDGWIRWSAPAAAIAIALPVYAYEYSTVGAAQRQAFPGARFEEIQP